MFLHFLLHLHHECLHGLLYFLVSALHETHDALLEFVIGDALFDKERVVHLGLLHENIDHHFHLVASALHCSFLRLHLLLNLIHLHRLRGLEGLQSLLLSQTSRLLRLARLLLGGQFALLCGHEHLGHLWILGENHHRLLELLCSQTGKHAKGLVEDDLAHRVLSHELLLDDVAVSCPVIGFESLTPLVNGLCAFIVATLASSQRHEVEHLACVRWVQLLALCVSLDSFKTSFFELGHDAACWGILIILTRDVMVKECGANQSRCGTDGKHDALLVFFDHIHFSSLNKLFILAVHHFIFK